MGPGCYRVIAWDTLEGTVEASFDAASSGALCVNIPPFTADIALAIRRV